MSKKSDSSKVNAAFKEVYEKVPRTVKATGKTGEAKRKMMVAVALSKARAAGANIPKKHDGGTVNGDDYELQAGELVQPPMQEFAPSTTDHPYAPLPFLNNDVLEDSPEHVRRLNNRSRDCRTGNEVTKDMAYPSS